MGKIIVFAVILSLCILFGCQSQNAPYPKIEITANGAKIPYYALPHRWDGVSYDRPGAFRHVFEKNPEMSGLAEVRTGDTITVDFKGNIPDSVAVEYEFLTVPYYPLTENTASIIDPIKLDFKSQEGRYSFTVDEMDSVWAKWLFTQHEGGVFSEYLHYIAGRVYKITASWGDDECEYAFVVKSQGDTGKEDIVLTDSLKNINVTLRRADNWEKIIDTPVISQDALLLIDGSTATLPITAELCRQFWDYSDQRIAEAINHSTTHSAYVNLINQYNRIRLIFVTPPSAEELQLAEKWDVELEITPIAKDGFVFITHKNNPIDSLTVEQVQAIYSGKTTNWKELGGEDLAIRAYQREPNSGSQTAMEQLVMDGIKMAAPTELTQVWSMFGLIDAVAEYENGRASLGYTYNYYINNLYKSDEIKVLKINGIAPDGDNLKNGSYPFATAYYAVIRGDEPPDSPARTLCDFLVGEKGQQLMAMAGYCTN